MGIYAGMDVSDKATHLCVVDGAGVVLRRDVVASDPEVLARWLKRHCPGLVRVVLDTGPLSTFLYHGLAERAVPVICICARHAKRALSARINKSDVNDAESLAQLARTGWFKADHLSQTNMTDTPQRASASAHSPIILVLLFSLKSLDCPVSLI